MFINLTGQRYKDEYYTYECLDLTVIDFNYRQYNLSEMNGREFIHTAPIGLLPLVPLMRHSDSEQARASLFLGLAVISSLKLSKEIILKVIEVSKMENSPLFDGIREEWMSKGEDKGKVKGIIFAILKTLEKNTGQKPDKFFESRLCSIDNEDTIEKLFYATIEAKSLEQFMIALEKVEQERAGR